MQESTSPQSARWRLFVEKLSGHVDWELGNHRTHNFNESVRLRIAGRCAQCGKSLYRTGWNTRFFECGDCGNITRDPANPSYTTMPPPPESPIPLPPLPMQPQHRLLGIRVTKRPQHRPDERMRHGTIVEIVDTLNMGFGAIAVVEYDDSTKIDLVALVEFSTKRDLWSLNRPDPEKANGKEH